MLPPPLPCHAGFHRRVRQEGEAQEEEEDEAEAEAGDQGEAAEEEEEDAEEIKIEKSGACCHPLYRAADAPVLI